MASCTSPHEVTKLAAGNHTLIVRATLALGGDVLVQSDTWEVAPRLRFTSSETSASITAGSVRKEYLNLISTVDGVLITTSNYAIQQVQVTADGNHSEAIGELVPSTRKSINGSIEVVLDASGMPAETPSMNYTVEVVALDTRDQDTSVAVARIDVMLQRSSALLLLPTSGEAVARSRERASEVVAGHPATAINPWVVNIGRGGSEGGHNDTGCESETISFNVTMAESQSWVTLEPRHGVLERRGDLMMLSVIFLEVQYATVTNLVATFDIANSVDLHAQQLRVVLTVVAEVISNRSVVRRVLADGTTEGASLETGGSAVWAVEPLDSFGNALPEGDSSFVVDVFRTEASAASRKELDGQPTAHFNETTGTYTSQVDDMTPYGAYEVYVRYSDRSQEQDALREPPGQYWVDPQGCHLAGSPLQYYFSRVECDANQHQEADPDGLRCQCMPGYYNAASSDASPLLCQECGYGRFNPRGSRETSRDALCSLCHDEGRSNSLTTLRPNATTEAECVCAPGYYSAQNANLSLSCAPCAPGYYQDAVNTSACSPCAVGTYAAEEGRSRMCTDECTNRWTWLYKCWPEEACVGEMAPQTWQMYEAARSHGEAEREGEPEGIQLSSCLEGYEGVLCAACADGWTLRSDGYCTECDTSRKIAAMRIVFTVLAIGMAMLIVLVWLQRPFYKELERNMKRRVKTRAAAAVRQARNSVTQVSSQFITNAVTVKQAMVLQMKQLRKGSLPGPQPGEAALSSVCSNEGLRGGVHRKRSAVDAASEEEPLRAARGGEEEGEADGEERGKGGAGGARREMFTARQKAVLNKRVAAVVLKDETVQAHAASLEPLAEGGASAGKGAEHGGLRVVMEMQAVVQQLGSVVLGLSQLLASYAAYQINWPGGYAAFLRALEPLNLGLMDLFGLGQLGCIFHSLDYLHAHVMYVLMPLVMTLWVLGAAAMSYKIQAARGHHLADPILYQFFVVRTVLIIFYLAYISISSRMLSFFDCTAVYDEYYLRYDLHVQCWVGEHRRYLPIAVLGVLLYPIGLPAVFTALLVWYRVPQLARRKRCAYMLNVARKELDPAFSSAPVSRDPMVGLETITLEELAALVAKVAARAEAAASDQAPLGVADSDYGSDGERPPEQVPPETWDCSAPPGDAAPPAPSTTAPELYVPDIDYGSDGEQPPEQALTVTAIKAQIEEDKDALVDRLVRWISSAQGSTQVSLRVYWDTTEYTDPAKELASTWRVWEAQAIMRAGFIIKSYHVDAWWYEIADLLRKLALSSIITFLGAGSATQVLAMALLCLENTVDSTLMHHLLLWPTLLVYLTFVVCVAHHVGLLSWIYKSLDVWRRRINLPYLATNSAPRHRLSHIRRLTQVWAAIKKRVCWDYKDDQELLARVRSGIQLRRAQGFSFIDGNAQSLMMKRSHSAPDDPSYEPSYEEQGNDIPLTVRVNPLYEQPRRFTHT
eukprot:gene2263-2981_t